MIQGAPRLNDAAELPWDSVPDLMYRVRGANGTIELLSGAFARLTGWSADEWIGRPFAELVYADDLPRATDSYTAVLRGEKAARHQLRIRTRAGGYVTSEFHGAPLVEQGHVVGEQGIAREITDQRRAGEAREASEERFRTLFEFANEALFLMDGTAFVDLNPKSLEMFGLRDRADMIGHTLADFSPPLQPDGRDSQEKAREYVLAALQGCPQRFYWKHARKDGSTFDAEVALHALTLHGRFHVQASVRDFTTPLAAEQAMRESDERFRVLVAQVPADVWTTDTNLRLTSIYGSLVPRLERPELRKTGTTLYELFDTRNDSHPVIAAHRRALRGVSVQYERRAGQLAIEGRVEPLRDGSGAIVGCVGVALDVTERRSAQSAVRRLTQFVESSEDAIVTTALDGTIETWNPSAEKLFGHRASEAIGQSITFIVPPDHMAAALSNIGQLEKGQPIGPYETQRVRSDQRVVSVSATLSPIRDARGAVVGASGIYRDITGRKQAEEALQASERRFRSLIEHGMDLVTIMGADGRFTYSSPSVTRLLGYEPGELIGDVGFGLVHPDDVPRVQATFGVALRGETASIRETFRFRHKDGSWRMFESVVTNLLGEPTVAGVVINSRDITDRMRAEDELRASEERLQSLFAGIDDAIFVHDQEGRIIDCNDAACRRLGYSRDELLAMHTSDVDAPEFAEGFHDRLAQQFERGRFVCEGVHLTKDGRRVPVEVSSSVIDYHGTKAVLAVMRDITDRKRAEAVLAKSEQELRHVLDRMQLIGLVVDTSGRITYCNSHLTEVSGWTREELIGSDCWSRFVPPNNPVIGMFQRAMATGEMPAHNVNELLTRNGQRREISWSNTLLHDSDGRLTGMVSIGEDVTDRKRAEEELRRSESEFRSLVEHAPLGIYRVTADGRFLTVNPAFITMLGYGWAEEVLRLNAARDVYAHTERRAELFAGLAENEQGQIETEWKRKDGSLITVRVALRAVRGPDGQVECYEGLVEDVTQQRSIENQFRQAQRMEAVGRLAGGVAHDFNNVLTAITGYSDLLLEDMGPDDPKRSDVGEIKAAALRAAALTRQLLAFSRKQVLQARVLDLNGVVRTLEKMLHRLIGEDVKLEFSLASALGAVRADPGQLEQVVMNLAVNSRDAMPKGGRLTIETANVDLDETYAREHAGATPGRYVMLAVSDTGTGMDAKTRSHVFEPFFTTKELGKGTGLGLATVYGIVKQSGGYVWVYSELGRGTTVKIYLPQVDELPERLDLAVPVQPVAGGRETVLLAEDDPSVRAIVADVLTQKGYRVLRAADGQAALEMARGQPGKIDLLVTDIVMPGMTGRELAEALTAARPGLRVLYMSGYTDDAVVRHGVLAEEMHYLQKPFSPRALASKVREVLDGP